MMDFKKMKNTSNSDLTKDFNTFAVKVGALMLADTSLPCDCDADAQMRPQW